MDELCRVTPNGCRDVFCPDCGWMMARKKGNQFLDDCVRLGVERVSTICVTQDFTRYTDHFHLASNRVASRLMAAVWPNFSRDYRKKWGDKPLWWCFREMHEGKRGGGAAKGRLHLHIYFPAPSKTGRVKRETLDVMRETGIKLSGRTVYGWTRQGVFAADVRAASGYASKAINYATKGVTEEGCMSSLAERRRLDLATRSRTVTVSDPKVVDSRHRALEQKRISERREAERVHSCNQRAESARRRGDRASMRYWKGVAASGVPAGSQVKPRRMRTHRERVLACGDTTWLQVPEGFRFELDVPTRHIRQALTEHYFQAGCTPGDVGRIGKWAWHVPREHVEAACDALGVPMPWLPRQTPPAPPMNRHLATAAGQSRKNNTTWPARRAAGAMALRTTWLPGVRFSLTAMTGRYEYSTGVRGARVDQAANRSDTAGGGETATRRILVSKALSGTASDDDNRGPP